MAELNVDILWEIEEDKGIEKFIYKAVETALSSENVQCPVTLSMVVTTNDNIQSLNLAHRQKDSVTDVLSFPGYEKEEWNAIKESDDMAYIGDIVVSKEKIVEQAIMYENTFEREFCYLTVHGMLHLMGYDHMNDEEKAVMRAKEEDIMKNLNLERQSI